MIKMMDRKHLAMGLQSY